jgi:hypothetical protein
LSVEEVQLKDKAPKELLADTLYLVLRDRFLKEAFLDLCKCGISKRRSQAEKISHRSYTALGRVRRQTEEDARIGSVALFCGQKVA